MATQNKMKCPHCNELFNVICLDSIEESPLNTNSAPKRKLCPVNHVIARQLSEGGYCNECGRFWTDEDINNYKKSTFSAPEEEELYERGKKVGYKIAEEDFKLMREDSAKNTESEIDSQKGLQNKSPHKLDLGLPTDTNLHDEYKHGEDLDKDYEEEFDAPGSEEFGGRR